MVPVRFPGAAAAFLLAALSPALACLPLTPTVPLSQPAFPTGLAVTADGNHLIVVSSDFDLAFNDGALLSADLTAVRTATRTGDDKTIVQGLRAYGTRGVILPPLGDRPVVAHLDGGAAGSDRVYIPVRQDNIVAAVDVAANGALSCGAAGTPQRCGVSPAALQLPQNDPFNVVITSASGTRVDGFTTLLSSPVITFFRDDTSLAGARRMRTVGAIDLGTDVGGIRSAILRPATNGSNAVVIAAADLSNAAGLIGAKLLLFPPAPVATGVTPTIASFDVTAATGALSTRDMVLVPASAQNGTVNDAVVVVLRPVGATCCDAVARFEIIDNGALPDLKLTGMKDTCKGPTQLAYAPSTAQHRIDRILLTCRIDDTVQAIDPVTLEPTDAIRFAGREPYGIVVNEVPDPPEAYVSFFADNSIGVLHLVDADQKSRLVFRGRIGAQSDKPEDGRQ